MKLREIEITAYVYLTMVLIAFLLSAGLAHCNDTTVQVISMYIKSKNHTITVATRHRIAESIVEVATISGIPYEVITAIMRAESSYDPNAIGPMGEIGLMQIYDSECAGIPYKRELLFDIKYNINAGVCKLVEKLVLSDGDIMEAIRRYNGSGPGALKFQKRVQSYILDIIRFRVAMNGLVGSRG